MKYLLGIGLLVAGISPAAAQSGNRYAAEKAILAGNSHRLGELLRKKAIRDSSFTPLVTSLEDVNFLVDTWLQRIDTLPYRRQYATELVNYAGLLDSASRKLDLVDIPMFLHFLDDDLTYKLDIQRNDPNQDVPETVTVKVRVYDSTHIRELPGYTPFVKPEISLDSRLKEAFNPTTNAEKNILPGKKLFWIEKNGKVLQYRNEGVKAGKAKVYIDFIIN
jgi:hypothetical protein